MAKINITKPTGNVESLNLISAFKGEGNIYVVLDSEKMGSMGLPIIYVSKYTNKLEKINDQNEWQSVKNYLKGIISGTNFEYVKINANIGADEAYYTPLTLPQASFDVIKNRYVVEENPIGNDNNTNTAPIMPNPNITSNTEVYVSPITSTSNISDSESSSVMNLIDEAYKKEPIVNNENISNVESPIPNSIPKNIPEPSNSLKEEINNKETILTTSSLINSNLMNFDNDKETFLKACENMFDALVSKYQKELNDLKLKEQELMKKESEINAKLKDANEHLANAEAREQVANIAHDNAQRVMDLNNFMPVNPNNNPEN